ncbi:hypothetical protein [Sinorhizobium meliloti]|uniref:hypothetical protein n=1 Tax=Rhizobium meliloti TaxID=382 RepID=UPI000FD84DA5|nr:hypothetical protein [Sinorhizobium meliloti]MDX0911934.1 hypothetical protein [Sinorhizobium medicae]MDW9537139.1 hypothetical protein [Sinorhizobium meliloti]MDX0965357.1 hypothetical protein [Sinorhizobium medicae]MDX1039490.1 hypothetical protein [Sinorhizobium medicae]MDX1051536.1 hypothetical protein [Sinorhizobium medicae]
MNWTKIKLVDGTTVLVEDRYDHASLGQQLASVGCITVTEHETITGTSLPITIMRHAVQYLRPYEE